MSKLPKGMAVVTNNEQTTVQLYSTNIVKSDSRWVQFDSGGWRTRHTLKCTNLFLRNAGINKRVFQKGGQWYIETTGTVVPYRDGIIISR